MDMSSSLKGKLITCLYPEGKDSEFYNWLGYISAHSNTENKRLCTVFFIAEHVALSTRICILESKSYPISYVISGDKKLDIDVIQESSDKEIEPYFDIAAIKVSYLNNFGSRLWDK